MTVRVGEALWEGEEEMEEESVLLTVGDAEEERHWEKVEVPEPISEAD